MYEFCGAETVAFKVTLDSGISRPWGCGIPVFMIVGEGLDVLIFCWDPMSAQPHDVDVKALLRMAVLYNIVVASNRSTADFMISSDYFNSAYQPIRKDYGTLI